jgi:glyoxylase-like metal-dependent hydrolase (beta-lactamase superfamily II)
MTFKLSIILLTATLLAQAQQPAAPGRGGGRGGAPQAQAIQPIKPGLFLITGAGANTVVQITNDGLIVVDGKLPGDANYNSLMALITGVSNKPIKYLLVTHHHQDHTGNDQKFLDAGVQVIGHENLKKELVTYERDPKPAPPNVTFSGADYTVKLGGITAEMHHFGRGHTSGDSIVYFPDAKVVCLSDIVTAGRNGPMIDYDGGGSAVELAGALAQVVKLDFDTAILGNGAPVTKADVEAFRTKYDAFLARARDMVRQGVSKDDLMNRLKAENLELSPGIAKPDAFYAELNAAR